jgi:hypothetical protein
MEHGSTVGKEADGDAADDPPEEVIRFETDEELLALVLRPYQAKKTQYLKTAVVETGGADPSAMLTVSGDFTIEESCYIDDTGHFNAVEFNICYNQLAYYLIAKSVKNGLVPVFQGWSLEDFWRLQLPNILITDFQSTFKRKMRGRMFSGSVSLTEAVRLERSQWWNPLIALRTSCQFWDESGSSCRGQVKIAITNPV